jgi:hypothetical protein
MTLSQRLAAQRATSITDPCFCEGPWEHLEPGDRPASVVAREHQIGTNGCRRVARPARFTAKDLTGRAFA